MQHSKKIMLCLLVFGFCTQVVSQPISPTQDVKSMGSTTTTSTPELPYKPEETAPPTLEESLPSTEQDPQSADQSLSAFSWDNLPYLTLKFPVLLPLPDPDF